MPRIPKEEVERVKQDISLVDLCKRYGIELTRQGPNTLAGVCRFHNDHDPSFVVTPSKNLWHCFGCGEGGDVFKLVMKLEGVSFRHAYELLTNQTPNLGHQDKPIKQATVPKLDCPLEQDAQDRELMLGVVDYYHETLKRSPEALHYLEERGITNSELIDRFNLGYANRTLGLRMPARNRQAGKELRVRLTDLGIFRESGHEHLNGSITVPIFDENGQCVEMYGRKVSKKLPKHSKPHLYLKGPHCGVWNLEAVQQSPEIILCESFFDAASFWCAGFRNVTFSYGADGFTVDQIRTVARSVSLRYHTRACGSRTD